MEPKNDDGYAISSTDRSHSCAQFSNGGNYFVLILRFCLTGFVRLLLAWSARASLQNGPPAVKSVCGKKCRFWRVWGGECEQGNRGADICACQVISWSRRGAARGLWQWQRERERMKGEPQIQKEKKSERRCNSGGEARKEGEGVSYL